MSNPEVGGQRKDLSARHLIRLERSFFDVPRLASASRLAARSKHMMCHSMCYAKSAAPKASDGDFSIGGRCWHQQMMWLLCEGLAPEGGGLGAGRGPGN